MSRTQGNNSRQEVGGAFLETTMVPQNPPSLGCSCSFSAHSTSMRKRKVGILAHQTKEEDALLISSADLTSRCRPHPPPMQLVPTGLLLLCGTASLMDQSQWSVALEWRDRTIPRWPDSFPGSYGFPRRTRSSKNTPPLHWRGTLTLENADLQNKLKVDMMCCRWTREYQRVPVNITDSSIPNLEGVCAFPKEKIISWTSVPETQIHYS